MAKEERTVGIGDRYRARHKFGRVWEVDAVYLDGVQRPHARMHAVETPSEERTIAVSVLLDRKHYLPVD